MSTTWCRRDGVEHLRTCTALLPQLKTYNPRAEGTKSCCATMKANRGNMLDAGVFNKVKYSRLAADDDGYIDLQFKRNPPVVPYKAIALALFLFSVGSLLIIFGALLLSGTIEVEHRDRTIPVIIIGILVFLPGFYHLRIAYYASKGYRGYSYDDIPDFGD
ncbi:transmembrane protein 230-like [Nerophis lumbriciformis]|uniref:transmembrane protein 230-like n=1 Tax=Nerophis lumbriciformis TaxID=546530 RepID=UPI003BAD1322